MVAKKFVSTGYQPPGSLYFALPSDYEPVDFSFYIIRLDTDGEPYYAAY